MPKYAEMSSVFGINSSVEIGPDLALWLDKDPLSRVGNGFTWSIGEYN